jgi:CheY-like chemotaxis protein
MNTKKQFNFLFVEDELFAQIIGRHIIEHAGHFLDVVSSAEQALTLLEKNQYHLIFLDLGLPNMSGLELGEKLRGEMNLKIPIVAVTAFDTASKKKECLENGFSDFMEKPFNDHKFKEMVNKFLMSSSADLVEESFTNSERS